MQPLKILVVLICKELALELRSKESLAIIFGAAITIGALSGFGARLITPNYSELQRLFPLLIWLGFFFACALALAKSFDAELAESGYEALLVMEVPSYLAYLAKVLVQCGVGLIGLLALAATDWVLMDLGGFLPPRAFFYIAALPLVGFVSLGVLLVAISATSHLRTALLPLLMFPLAIPLFFAAQSLSNDLFTNGAIELGNPWLSLLVGLDILYFLLGFNLYEYALRD